MCVDVFVCVEVGVMGTWQSLSVCVCVGRVLGRELGACVCVCVCVGVWRRGHGQWPGWEEGGRERDEQR